MFTDVGRPCPNCPGVIRWSPLSGRNYCRDCGHEAAPSAPFSIPELESEKVMPKRPKPKPKPRPRPY